MYTVLYHIPENTAELEDWLNERLDEGLELVSADGHYYAFRQLPPPVDIHISEDGHFVYSPQVIGSLFTSGN